MSLLTTTPLQVAPAAAAGVTVTAGGTAWVSGAWVTLIAVTAAPTAVAGVHLGGTFATEDWELDLGTGAPGVELVIGTLRLYGYNSGAATGPSGIGLPVPLGGIATGVRVAGRVRRGTGSGGSLTVALSYYSSPDTDQITTSAQVLSASALGTASPTLTPSATPWANSAWVELVGSASSRLGLLGLVHGVVPAGAEGGVEFDLGTGPASAETVITTLRDAHTGNSRWPYTWLPGLYPLAAGTRLSVRLRKAGTDTTPYPVCALFYPNL